MNDCHKSLNINNLRRPGSRKSLITKGLQKNPPSITESGLIKPYLLFTNFAFVSDKAYRGACCAFPLA